MLCTMYNVHNRYDNHDSDHRLIIDRNIFCMPKIVYKTIQRA